MADDRSLWALRRTTRAPRQGVSKLADGAVSDARQALEWMRLRLAQLRQEHQSNEQPSVRGVGQSASGTCPPHTRRPVR
jgi:hypothetical protein